MGYRFDFSDVIRKFLVNQHGGWSEYYAPDKTSLREILYGRINQIVESQLKPYEYEFYAQHGYYD